MLPIAQPSRVYAANCVKSATKASCDCGEDNLDKNNCGIISYLLLTINVLSGLVGAVVIIMIIIGGIQYSSAGADPQKIQAAKSKITSAVLALVVFIAMFAFLQWVVPGGLF